MISRIELQIRDDKSVLFVHANSLENIAIFRFDDRVCSGANGEPVGPSWSEIIGRHVEKL